MLLNGNYFFFFQIIQRTYKKNDRQFTKIRKKRNEKTIPKKTKRQYGNFECTVNRKKVLLVREISCKCIYKIFHSIEDIRKRTNWKYRKISKYIRWENMSRFG